MEYFYLSPFYEKNSINQNCLIQKSNFNTQRFRQVGVEFNLEHMSKDKELYFISKNYRKYSEAVLISYYYVFKGTIYQSPDIFSILTSNIESISNNFNNIISELNN